MSLDKPVFVEKDPEVIMAECKSQLEAELGREIQPGQIEQLILQFIVYREILLLERFNAGMSQMFYQFAQAPMLDYVAALVAVERLPASYAGCTVNFQLVEGHGSVVIPEGTRVSTSDGIIFATTDDIIIPESLNSINIEVLAEEASKEANGYAVNQILDPLAFVSSVSNINITGGGSDIETDEQLRERIKLAPSQFSTAGSRSSYIYHAKRANSSIIDVSVTSPIPGTVLIVPLVEGGDVPQQVITDVNTACSGETVRPLTDTVIVAAPTPREYSIKVNITAYLGSDLTKVKNDVYEALSSFADEKIKTLGQDIVISEIIKESKKSLVYDVEVISPLGNIIVEDNEFAKNTEIIVEVTGENKG